MNYTNRSPQHVTHTPGNEFGNNWWFSTGINTSLTAPQSSPVTSRSPHFPPVTPFYTRPATPSTRAALCAWNSSGWFHTIFYGRIPAHISATQLVNCTMRLCVCLCSASSFPASNRDTEIKNSALHGFHLNVCFFTTWDCAWRCTVKVKMWPSVLDHVGFWLQTNTHIKTWSNICTVYKRCAFYMVFFFNETKNKNYYRDCTTMHSLLSSSHWMQRLSLCIFGLHTPTHLLTYRFICVENMASLLQL